jgi:deazaflavin-dependent oxidoreductase (nitroreductase family)
VSRPGGRKFRLSKWLTTKVVNPGVRALIERDLFPSAWSLLETTGRRSGQPRRVPIGNGLRGDTFWIVTEHGHHADYVRNIEADPRVRVKVGRRWHAGTAHVLDDDDPRERLRWLKRPVNDTMLRAAASEPLTVRIDLDRG